MAAAFTVNVYGTVASAPPYDGNLTPVQATFSSANIELASFPVGETNVWGATPGFQMIGGVFCYGVVEVRPGGLQQYSQKFIVKENVATLATLRG